MSLVMDTPYVTGATAHAITSFLRDVSAIVQCRLPQEAHPPEKKIQTTIGDKMITDRHKLLWN